MNKRTSFEDQFGKQQFPSGIYNNNLNEHRKLNSIDSGPMKPSLFKPNSHPKNSLGEMGGNSSGVYSISGQSIKSFF